MTIEYIRITLDWLINNNIDSLLNWIKQNFTRDVWHLKYLAMDGKIDALAEELNKKPSELQYQLVEIMYN